MEFIQIRVLSFTIFSDRVDLLVLVKPWVRIDGSLNRRVLDRMLGSVLSHILQKPGNSLRELADRFHPAIQPFHVRELVEVRVFLYDFSSEK